MAEKVLTNFITEARKRGFPDNEIRKAMENKSWPQSKIDSAFGYLNPKFKIKNQVCIFLSNEVLSALQKRAKKNMLTLQEQIEDILRRSCTRKTSIQEQEKLDDLLLTCFSRKRAGKR
jgi:DNA-binding transcriptional MerR regulator